MSHWILVLNCGSSSIKYALFDARITPLPRTPSWSGKIDGIKSETPTLTETNTESEIVPLDITAPYGAALELIWERVQTRLGTEDLGCVVHRIVHGGSKYFAAARLSIDVLNDLRSYIPLAPLHQPFALEAVERLLRIRPDIPQVACFDTAFHQTMPRVEQMLPLPRKAWERGIRRYGFHGLSYEYIVSALSERHGALARQRCVVAHLGSGASLCALLELRSVATTMGFSALDGLMMGTRCGSLDPGAVIYLMEVEKLSLDQVAQLLYHESGLLGVSGRSHDLRDLLAAETSDEHAKEAIALYVHRICQQVAALTASLQGLDLLVFTAGVGENNAEIRKRVCQGLHYLGVEIDEEANRTHQAVISTPSSKVLVGIEPTNEEWIAARQALEMGIVTHANRG